MRTIASAALCAVALVACGKPAAPTESPKTVADAAPTAAKPISGIDKTQFDPSVRAQDDFYRHVNGTWMKSHPVPAEKSNYGSFTKLADDAEAQLKQIIETAAAKTDKQPGSDEQKVGDYYTAFMNEARADELGLKPLQSELAGIDALDDKAALASLMAHLSRIGVNVIPGFIDTDAKDSSQYMVYLFQGGTGLPDRDYYLDPSDEFAQIRAKYQSHIGSMLSLTGVDDAEAQAAAIMKLETRLAEKQWDKVDSRDADKTYNKYAFADLPKLMPDFDWPAFIDGMGIGKSPGLVISQPSFFEAFDGILKDTDLGTIKAWLKWQLVSSYAPFLSKPFVDENFAFYGTTLNGITELKPRWKRGVDATEGALGEVLGRIYVSEHFPPEAKARMGVLVQNLVKAYEASIKDLDWMSDETKTKALEKLAKFTPKIGYPDKWKDYSALSVTADDLVGNVMRSNQVEHAREAAKLGGPIDRNEWHMTPQTVNAYYNPGMNEIVFPAAILQPPFFDMNADDAVNYGGIGAVIGHEIGHGFDDQGSKYDGDGNLKSWWTDEDRKRFEERTKALIAQYDGYEALPGEHVNGAFTIGENIGDLGGLSIAYTAYHMQLGGKEAPVIDDLTGDQRLFMGWAQVWRRNYKDENLLQRLKSDPHSPSEFRCNGIVRNLPGWYAAFDVKESDKLYLPPDQRVKIW
ncbi:peptidase M13 [Sinimarinibacterium sp. CAU 1509]|uniref:M13 family metallopeptidase n=1 Tax=Sinimarinibacterium sp. CAU 1509 TaxID=2562283 RepID=UPI0010AD724D|nr:M13-type metalloendopeptidase [Sinimarinibacterium sp. CAU 1509]TJY58191.1 peptidase M13 [Sinimarinibacterium sp. CAU 1509]